MRITWVTRSFLDYRIPVYKEINRLCNNNLTVIYYKDIVPVRCQDSLEKVLGNRAVGLSGEIRFGGKKTENQAFANTGGLRIPIRPGLIKLVRKTRPDIIMSDGFFQWTYAALVNRAIWKTPHLMCYERTLHTERNVTKIRLLARKLASRYIDGVCCNGIQTKEYLLHFGFPEEKLFLGNMAADSEGLKQAVSRLGTDDTDQLKRKYTLQGKIFLYVGQLIPRKGIMELLNVWQDFEKMNHPLTLILLGGGEQLTEVETVIKKNQLKSVRIPGKVDYSEVAGFYAAADIFLMPTLEDNWSLVVPEAMSCGLPILCSKYNGCWPELVKQENGWVFDPLDNENFIKTLQMAWDEKDNWAEMGTRSQRIIEDYAPHEIAKRIYSACTKTIQSQI